MSVLKAAVISREGLGDGLVSLILAHNLQLNGWEVSVFQNGICDDLHPWLPQLKVISGYTPDQVEKVLEKFDRIFIFYCEKDPFTHEIIKKGKKIDELKITVINACFSKDVGNQPYYRDSLFHPHVSIVDNMKRFCDQMLHLSNTTKHVGFVIPKQLDYQKNNKRVCLHVTSSREGKNWPIEKYVNLALLLRKKGFDPAFVMAKQERDRFLFLEKDFVFPIFENLLQTASFIYESGYFIGNDSGVGHLSSSLGIPTVTLTRGRRISRLWRPSWTLGKVVYPHPWIPNISGFRLRDRHWKKFISVRKVLSAFDQLRVKSEAL